jgi:hypothetical protein
MLYAANDAHVALRIYRLAQATGDLPASQAAG